MGRKRLHEPHHSEDIASCQHPKRPQQQPLQRTTANARERARMRVLSKAFLRLKTSLPWVPRDTKLSKLDTLRLASAYIRHLARMLDEEVLLEGESQEAVHPVALTWPFSFQRGAPSKSTSHFVPCTGQGASTPFGPSVPAVVDARNPLAYQHVEDSSFDCFYEEWSPSASPPMRQGPGCEVSAGRGSRGQLGYHPCH